MSAPMRQKVAVVAYFVLVYAVAYLALYWWSQ